jgi:hypothetical protein
MAIFKITEVNITKIEIILTSTRHQTICSVIENLRLIESYIYIYIYILYSLSTPIF